jgi:hypothetical protein
MRLRRGPTNVPQATRVEWLGRSIRSTSPPPAEVQANHDQGALSDGDNGPPRHCQVPASVAAPVHTTMGIDNQSSVAEVFRWSASSRSTADPGRRSSSGRASSDCRRRGSYRNAASRSRWWTAPEWPPAPPGATPGGSPQGLTLPLNSPGILRRGMRALRKPTAALHIPLTFDTGRRVFLSQFASHCRRSSWMRAMGANVAINEDCIEAFDVLIASGVDAPVTDTPITAIFRTTDQAERI